MSALLKMRQHFITRCAERVPEIDGRQLWDDLSLAIFMRDYDLVDKIARTKYRRECWRFHVGETTLYAIWCPRFLCPVTVLLPGQTIRRYPKGQVKRLQ